MGQWASGAAGVLETREATTPVSPLWRQAVALVWREGGVASSAWRRLLASAGRCAWALAHTTGSRCPPQHYARQDGPPPLAVTLSGADTLFSQA